MCFLIFFFNIISIFLIWDGLLEPGSSRDNGEYQPFSTRGLHGWGGEGAEVE